MRAQTPFGELRVEVEQVEVTSSGPRPDKDWRYTDQKGHEHYWRNGYPTIVEVVDRTYWCPDCEDEHQDTHLECPICHEHISPGMLGPSMWREFVPGRRSYWLNGEPVSEERANEIIAEMRRQRDTPGVNPA